MAYAFQPHLYIENGPAVQAAKAREALSTSSAYRAWRQLDREHRLAVVEETLARANDDTPMAKAC